MTRHQFLWLRNQPVCKNLFSVSQWLCSLFVCMSKFPCNVVNVHIITHVFSSSLCYISCVFLSKFRYKTKNELGYTRSERANKIGWHDFPYQHSHKYHTMVSLPLNSRSTSTCVATYQPSGSTNEIKGLLNIYFAIRRLTFIALSLLQYILHQKDNKFVAV